MKKKVKNIKNSPYLLLVILFILMLLLVLTFFLQSSNKTKENESGLSSIGIGKSDSTNFSNITTDENNDSNSYDFNWENEPKVAPTTPIIKETSNKLVSNILLTLQILIIIFIIIILIILFMTRIKKQKNKVQQVRIKY